LSIHSSVAVIQ